MFSFVGIQPRNIKEPALSAMCEFGSCSISQAQRMSIAADCKAASKVTGERKLWADFSKTSSKVQHSRVSTLGVALLQLWARHHSSLAHLFQRMFQDDMLQAAADAIGDHCG